MGEDGFKESRHVGSPLFTRQSLLLGGPAVDAGGIDHWEIKLLIIGAEFVKQIESRIDHKIGASTGLVHLIDHQNGPQAQGQGFFGHKPGLRHRAFLSIDQEHHAIDHGERTLNLTTKVRVSGGVDNVDVGAVPGHCAVLGQNRDATLFFNGVVVHDGVNDFFMFGKGARLAQQLVNHGGFSVVNVGNDGNVSNGKAHIKLSRMELISTGLSKRSAMSSPAFTWAVPSKLLGGDWV